MLRTRKELVYLNIKDLTQEEIAKLSDFDLNCCDNCGEIDLSERLYWIEGENFSEDINCKSLLASGMLAICQCCHEKKDKKIAQCCSCEQYFIAHKDKDNECPHCYSGNWVMGSIDEPGE